MAEAFRSKCCSFDERLGISDLQNDLNDVNWPSLTNDQQKKKLRQPGAVHIHNEVINPSICCFTVLQTLFL